MYNKNTLRNIVYCLNLVYIIGIEGAHGDADRDVFKLVIVIFMTHFTIS